MIRSYRGIAPQVASSAFVEQTACVIGDVHIGEESSLWFNVVVRGDVNFIRIGKRSNVQDGSVVHVSHETHPTVIGDDVTIGHNVTLHGCTIGNGCLVGIGATILDGVVIGDHSLVAAGSLLPPGLHVPPHSLVMGSPGRVRRQLADEECARLMQAARNYVVYREEYLAQMERSD